MQSCFIVASLSLRLMCFFNILVIESREVYFSCLDVAYFEDLNLLKYNFLTRLCQLYSFV